MKKTTPGPVISTRKKKRQSFHSHWWIAEAARTAILANFAGIAAIAVIAKI
jgi:hypothetical protein